MTYLSFLEKKVLLERLVIGLEQPVLIKGLGELQAKIDSGNGGYNVIHGTDFHQQGDILTFSTQDSSGKIKKISTKVIQQIQVNMGGGNIEVRPVVELDLKFAGEDYKKIPFSVSDRSSNTNPILISKGFVQNQLQALIDVGATNISGDGIEVVYGQSTINQGLISGFKKGWNAVSKVGNAISTGLKKVGNAVDTATKWGKGGDDVNVFAPLQFGLKVATGLTVGALGSLFGGIYSIAKVLTKTDTIVDKDKKQISGKLPNATAHRKLKQLQNKGVTIEGTIWQNYNKFNFKNAEIFPIVSFKGRAGDLKNGHVVSGMQARVQNWKQAIKTAQEAAKNSKSTNTEQKNTQNQNTTQEEQQYFNECFTFQVANALLTQETNSFNSLMEDMNAMYYADKANQQQNTTQQNQQSSQQQTNNQQQNEQQTQQQNQQNSTEKPQKQYVSDENTKNMQQTVTQFEQLNTFILYFIPTRLSKKDDKKIDSKSKEFITKFLLEPKKLDKNLIKFFNHNKIDGNSAKPMVKDLAAAMRQAVEKDFKNGDQGDYYQGFFVLCCGQPDKRQITIFDSAEQCVYKTLAKDESSQQEPQKRDIENDFPELYDRFNFLDSNVQEQMRKDTIYNYSKKIQAAVAKIDKERQDAKNGASRKITSSRVYQIAKERVIDNGILQTAIVYDELSKTSSGQQILKVLGINSTINGTQVVSSWEDFQEKVSAIENSNELIDNYVKQTQGQQEESEDNQQNQQEDKQKDDIQTQKQEETKPTSQQNQPNPNTTQVNQPRNKQKSNQGVDNQGENNTKEENNGQQRPTQPRIQKQPTVIQKPKQQQVSQQQVTTSQREDATQTNDEVSTSEEPIQKPTQEIQQKPNEKQSTTPQMDDLTRKLGGENILKDQEENKNQKDTQVEEQQSSDTDTNTQNQTSENTKETSTEDSQQNIEDSTVQETTNQQDKPTSDQPQQSKSPKFDQTQKQIQKKMGIQDSSQETQQQGTQNTNDGQQQIIDDNLGTGESSTNTEEHIIDDSNLVEQPNDQQVSTEEEITPEQQTEGDNISPEQQNISDQSLPNQEEKNIDQKPSQGQITEEDTQTPDQQVTIDDQSQTQQSNDGDISIEQQPTQEQISDQQINNEEQISDGNQQQTQISEESPDITQAGQQSQSQVSSNVTNQKTRIKSRTQMNAHARKNKKAHMKKGKKKGSGKSNQNEQQVIDRFISDSIQYKSGKVLIQSIENIWRTLFN